MTDSRHVATTGAPVATAALASRLGVVFIDVLCPLCGAADAPVRHLIRGRVLDHEFSIRECPHCSLFFTSPRLSSESLQRYYDSEAVEDLKDTLRIPSHHTFDAIGLERNARDAVSLWRVVQRRDGRPASNLPTLLDVGCGFGQFLKVVAPLSIATGIEISEFCVARARAQVGSAASVRHAFLCDLIATGEQFDIVTAFEVVEHLTDPAAFFREVRQVLKPGGIFYYSTGNVQGKIARRTGATWEYWAPEEHLLFYSPSTMTRFLTEAGLTATWRRDLPLRAADESHRSGVAALKARRMLNAVTYRIYRAVSRYRDTEAMPFGVCEP